MRLDCRTNLQDECAWWRVVDARTGLFVIGVVWADDETHEIGRYGPTPAWEPTVVEHVPKLRILFDRKTILINAKEIEEDAGEERVVARGIDTRKPAPATC